MNELPKTSSTLNPVQPGGGNLLLRSALFAVAALAIIGLASWGVLTAGGDPDTPSPAGGLGNAFNQGDDGQARRDPKQGAANDGDAETRLRRFTYTDGDKGKKKTPMKDHDKDQDNDHDGDPDD
jgi:hypothetical protein